MSEQNIWTIVYYLAIGLVLFIIITFLLNYFIKHKSDIQVSTKTQSRIIRSIALVTIIFFLNVFVLEKLRVNFNNQSWYLFTKKTVNIMTVLLIYIFISSLLEIILEVYQSFKVSKKMPIKAIIQAIRFVLIIIFSFGVIAIIMDQNPLVVMGSVSTIAAFVSFIFKDILLGFVAGIQLTVNKTVQLGDYIAIPALNSEGTITSIGLTTITIQNLDESVSTLPAYGLISNPLINYRHIYESGQRQFNHRLFLKPDFVKVESSTINMKHFIQEVRELLESKSEIIQFKPIHVLLGDAEFAGIPLTITCYISIIDLQAFNRYKTNLVLEILECAQKQGLLNDSVI